MTTEFGDTDERDQLRRANEHLQRQLRAAKSKAEALVEAAQEGAKEAMIAFGPVPPIPAPKHDKRTRGPEVALWHLTDWQGAKLTSSYNSEIMRRRVLQFCTVAERFTEIHRADHPVRECAVAFGGDMVEGLFQFPGQPFEIDQTIFGQYVAVARLIVDVIRRALAIYERVDVTAEWGNHGRIGSKRDAVPRSDNFDRMTYELARQLLADEKRLTFPDCPEDIQHLEVGAYRALVVHGDEIGRSGYASKTSIIQGVNRWRAGAHRWEFRDVYIGHFHQYGEDPLANGEGSIFWTGSTESDNRYASDRLVSSSTPSQRLNFIDPEAGRVTSSHKVWLD